MLLGLLLVLFVYLITLICCCWVVVGIGCLDSLLIGWIGFRNDLFWFTLFVCGFGLVVICGVCG